MKNTEELKRVQGYFRKFFNEYYPAHREIKSLSYMDMEDGEGFSAVLDYGSFIQYINYYCRNYGSHTINSCFLLENNGNPFICHFDDILDELLSEDISFYTYEKCVSEERIINALNSVTEATQRYFFLSKKLHRRLSAVSRFLTKPTERISSLRERRITRYLPFPEMHMILTMPLRVLSQTRSS